MHEVKTTLRRIAVGYLLLVINIIPCANLLPDVFPARNSSTTYLLILSVCLVLYYSHRVTPTGSLSVMMKSLSWMALLLILLRGVKYSAFSGVGVLARHTWYLYYVPMLLFPLFFFYIAILVSPKENTRLAKGWYWMLALTVVIIVLILTNDLHQLAFRIQPGFENWDGDYSRGWLYWLIAMAAATLAQALLLRYQIRYDRTFITPGAIKLYLDQIPCGICCWRDSGRVLFSNICMNELCLAVIHRPLLNGNDLRDAVSDGILTVNGKV